MEDGLSFNWRHPHRPAPLTAAIHSQSISMMLYAILEIFPDGQECLRVQQSVTSGKLSPIGLVESYGSIEIIRYSILLNSHVPRHLIGHLIMSFPSQKDREPHGLTMICSRTELSLHKESVKDMLNQGNLHTIQPPVGKYTVSNRFKIPYRFRVWF